MHNCNCESQRINDDYLAMLNILCAALQIYSIDQTDKQGRDIDFSLNATDKILEKMEKLEGKLKKIERMIERSVYNA